MSMSEAKRHAKHARAQRTAEAKLDDIAKAIEELASALSYVETRVKNTEYIVENIANRIR